MVKQLQGFLAAHWKSIITLIVGVFIGAVTMARNLGIEETNIRRDLIDHDKRVTKLEESDEEQNRRLRTVEKAVPQIQTDLAWLVDHAKRNAK